MIAVHENRGKY
jgi:hypothetical protein